MLSQTYVCWHNAYLLSGQKIGIGVSKKGEKTLYLMKAGTMGILHLDVSTTDFVLDVVFLLTGQLFLNA